MIKENNQCRIKGGRWILALPLSYLLEPQLPHLENGDDAATIAWLVRIR